MRIIRLIDSNDSEMALAASKDILDRAGHTPKQVSEMNINMTGGFRVEFVDRLETPTITINGDAQ
jgi:hypothetical protein